MDGYCVFVLPVGIVLDEFAMALLQPTVSHLRNKF
jgi:hypothetical protein